jgi:pimeloyl-ACP methyl ester carboxylesterase
VKADQKPSLDDPVIHVPVLHIVAKNDMVRLPITEEELKEVIPDITLRTVNTGHWAGIEDPEGVNGFISYWFKEVVLGGRSSL